MAFKSLRIMPNNGKYTVDIYPVTEEVWPRPWSFTCREYSFNQLGDIVLIGAETV